MITFIHILSWISGIFINIYIYIYNKTKREESIFRRRKKNEEGREEKLNSFP